MNANQQYELYDYVLYKNKAYQIICFAKDGSNYDAGIKCSVDGHIELVMFHEITPNESAAPQASKRLRAGQRVFHAGEKFYVSTMNEKNYILINENYPYGKEVEPELIVPVDIAINQINAIEKALFELQKLISKLMEDHCEQRHV